MVSKWVWQWCKPPHCKARYLFQVPTRLTNYQPQYVRHWLTLVTEHTTAHTGLASLLMPSFSIVSLCSGMAYVRQAWLRVTKDCKIFCTVYRHMFDEENFPNLVFCLLSFTFVGKELTWCLRWACFKILLVFALLHIFMFYICEWTMSWCWMPWMFVWLLCVCFFFCKFVFFYFFPQLRKGQAWWLMTPSLSQRQQCRGRR